jgi:hypothetical protein
MYTLNTKSCQEKSLVADQIIVYNVDVKKKQSSKTISFRLQGAELTRFMELLLIFQKRYPFTKRTHLIRTLFGMEAEARVTLQERNFLAGRNDWLSCGSNSEGRIRALSSGQ